MASIKAEMITKPIFLCFKYRIKLSIKNETHNRNKDSVNIVNEKIVIGGSSSIIAMLNKAMSGHISTAVLYTTKAAAKVITICNRTIPSSGIFASQWRAAKNTG